MTFQYMTGTGYTVKPFTESLYWVHAQFLVVSLLLNFYICCVVLCFYVFFLRPVSCVYNVSSVSGLSILDCPFGFFSNGYLLNIGIHHN